jgi:hypothetical protein
MNAPHLRFVAAMNDLTLLLWLGNAGLVGNAERRPAAADDPWESNALTETRGSGQGLRPLKVDGQFYVIKAGGVAPDTMRRERTF